MKILCFGSLNVDHVYRVDTIVKAGETIDSHDYRRYIGGKGLNQTMAAAAAGGTVLHAGCIGADGRELLEALERRGVDGSLIRMTEHPTGHAIIQVGAGGENAIIIHGGANRDIGHAQVEEVIARGDPGDILLLQNEINEVAYIIWAAERRGLRVFFNAAPCDRQVAAYPIELLDTLIVNEIEGAYLSGREAPEAILDVLTTRYPALTVILTLGAGGARYARAERRLQVAAPEVRVVDTTAAGDTFVGYYATCCLEGCTPQAALHMACVAASLSVERAGAVESIPERRQVEERLAG